jgi:hypothetical protein
MRLHKKTCDLEQKRGERSKRKKKNKKKLGLYATVVIIFKGF